MVSRKPWWPHGYNPALKHKVSVFFLNGIGFHTKKARLTQPEGWTLVVLLSLLRCGRDSNSRPPAWQAGILTSWTTAPGLLPLYKAFGFCSSSETRCDSCRVVSLSFACAKLRPIFDSTKYFGKNLHEKLKFLCVKHSDWIVHRAVALNKTSVYLMVMLHCRAKYGYLDR